MTSPTVGCPFDSLKASSIGSNFRQHASRLETHCNYNGAPAHFSFLASSCHQDFHQSSQLLALENQKRIPSLLASFHLTNRTSNVQTGLVLKGRSIRFDHYDRLHCLAQLSYFSTLIITFGFFFLIIDISVYGFTTLPQSLSKPNGMYIIRNIFL